MVYLTPTQELAINKIYTLMNEIIESSKLMQQCVRYWMARKASGIPFDLYGMNKLKNIDFTDAVPVMKVNTKVAKACSIELQKVDNTSIKTVMPSNRAMFLVTLKTNLSKTIAFNYVFDTMMKLNEIIVAYNTIGAETVDEIKNEFANAIDLYEKKGRGISKLVHYQCDFINSSLPKHARRNFNSIYDVNDFRKSHKVDSNSFTLYDIALILATNEFTSLIKTAVETIDNGLNDTFNGMNYIDICTLAYVNHLFAQLSNITGSSVRTLKDYVANVLKNNVIYKPYDSAIVTLKKKHDTDKAAALDYIVKRQKIDELNHKLATAVDRQQVSENKINKIIDAWSNPWNKNKNLEPF